MLKKIHPRLKFLVAGCAVVLAGVTCTDNSVTGPHSGHGGLSRFGFVPAFSRAAAEIFQNLEAFGFEVDNVHLHLNHADGQTAKDTVVVVVPGQDSVVIELTVSLDASQEQLSANIELRDGSTVLFSGTEEIAAKTGAIATAPPAIPVEYTGPGAAATTLLLAPHDTAVIAGDSLVLHPSGKDKNGANVPDLALAWSVKDAARGTVNDKGVFKASAGRGATYVVGRLLSGPRDSAHINVTPPATKVVLVSGGGQTGTVGKALSQPIVVETQAADNLPVPFVPLGFHVNSGGGSVSSASAFTDANGRATVALTLGTTAGPNSVGVDLLASQALVVSATGNPDKATKLAVSQQPSANALSGTALATQPKVQVLDPFGNAVAAANIGITVKLTTAGGRALGGTLTVNTNASGVATFTDLKISGPPGTASLTFGQDTLASAVSSDVVVAIGPAATMALDGASVLSVAAGATIANPPSIVVSDAGGNGVAGVGVQLVVTGNGATASNATINTDANGRVSLGAIPALSSVGDYTITASNAALSGSPLTVHLGVTAGPAHHLAFVQQPPARPTGGSSFTSTVAVLDQFGNRVTTGTASTAAVTLTLNGPAGATLGPSATASVQSAIAGLATFNVSVDKANNGYSLTAAAAAPIIDATSGAFNVAIGAPAQLLVFSGEGQGVRKGMALANPIVARVVDAGGNDVNLTPITFSITSGGGSLNGTSVPITVNANSTGQALAQVNWQAGVTGVQLVHAQAGSVSVDFHAFLAEALVVIQQPSLSPRSGETIAVQPQVQLQDLQHNAVKLPNFPIIVTVVPAQNIDLSMPSLSPTTIQFTDNNGVSTSVGLTLTGQVRDVRLHFADTNSVSDVSPTESATLSLVAGPASTFGPANSGSLYYRFVQGTTTASVGVSVTDGHNPVAGASIAFFIDQGLCALGAATATTDASGVASIGITLPTSANTSSCIIRGQPNIVGGGGDVFIPESNKVRSRVFIAPDGMVVWTGAISDDWTNASNWFGHSVPDASADVFVGAAAGAADALFRYPKLPDAVTSQSTHALMTESNTHIDLNGKELYVTDSLAADGPIIGHGTVGLGIAETRVRGYVFALLELGEDGCPVFHQYRVSGLLVADSILANCRLVLSDTFAVEVLGDFRASAGSGELWQTDGGVFIGGKALFAGGSLTQTGGVIEVAGDATFNGHASLSGGTLALLHNFSHAGDCETFKFVATGSHVTIMSGDASADSLRLTWDSGCGSRFAKLVIATTGTKGVALSTNLLSPPSLPMDQLSLAPGSSLNVPSIFIMSISSNGMIDIESGALLRFEGSPPGGGICSLSPLIQGDNIGPNSCSFPPL